MKLQIPWIISRRRFFFAISLDFFLCFFYYNKNFFNQFKAYPNSIVVISISGFWIILSYILGRYMIKKKFILSEIFKSLLKALFVFIVCNFIYLSINLSTKFLLLTLGNTLDYSSFEREEYIFFLKNTLSIAFISYLLQYILSILTNRIYRNKKSWIFYGSIEGFNNFLKEIGIAYKTFDFKQIGYDFDINKLNFEGTEGIIVDNNKEINKYNLDQIFYFKSKGIKVINILKWCENELHRIPPFFIENKYQIIEKFNLLDESYKIRIKRIGDFIVSLLLVFITSPLFVLISLLIYMEDGGPIFYSQIRTGFKGKKITIHKFRSMIVDAEKYGPQWSSKLDNRITKVGRVIRALRIDELPQLFSVLEGTMSLIGPRPERPEIEESLLNTIPYYKYRNILKPGISGWAQVNYNYGASKDDTVNKLSYDIYYINHISFFLDLLILIKTIKIIFNAKTHKPNTD